MTQQKAKVVRLLEGPYIEVAVRRQSACGHNCDSCGGGCNEMLVQSQVKCFAFNDVGADVGDTVTIESSTSGVLSAAALLYLAPVALFLMGYFIPQSLLSLSEAWCLLLGGVGFLLGIASAWLLDRKLRKNRSIEFRVVAVERKH